MYAPEIGSWLGNKMDSVDILSIRRDIENERFDDMVSFGGYDDRIR